MLDWLTGSSRPVEGTLCDEGHSHIDPETPAPQFAIRALRSALLGTPRVKQSIADQSVEQRQGTFTAVVPYDESRPPLTSRNDTPSSPTKGILLTPGTGPNRRKTVSFGNLMPSNENSVRNIYPNKDTSPKINKKDVQKPVIKAKVSPKEHKAILTKSLFETQLEDSKRRIDRESSAPQLRRTEKTVDLDQGKDVRPAATLNAILQGPETTVDLNIPCSTSGKHWKGEYELYHRKSNRELKRIIQHGQTIKSYAQRKDAEATSLNEKMKIELAKVASMEAKVSELAIQLANARSHVNNGGSSAGIMNDLAKQTTLAIQYKQRADSYRAALDQERPLNACSDQANNGYGVAQDDQSMTFTITQNDDMKLLREDLEKLRSAVRTAEEKSSKLQLENTTLKQKMARVKDEMKNYETRRLTREERLKKRELKLISAKECCEARLADLAVTHQKLLSEHGRCRNAHSLNNRQTSGIYSKNSEEPGIILIKPLDTLRSCDTGNSTASRSKNLSESNAAMVRQTAKMGRLESLHHVRNTRSCGRSKSPLFRESESSLVQDSVSEPKRRYSFGPISQVAPESSADIWTYETSTAPTEGGVTVPQTPRHSEFSLLRQETYDALREIDSNSVADESQLKPKSIKPELQCDSRQALDIPKSTYDKPTLSPAVRRMQARRSTIASPRPSLLGFASSPTNPDMQSRERGSVRDWNARSSKLLSIGTRTSALNCAGRRLPPNRAEAARKRLEVKKGEKNSRCGDEKVAP